MYLEILGDCPLPWSVSLPGGDLLESEIAGLALERGGHLRVGLEDYARFAASPDTTPGEPTNLELLERATKLCDEVGRSVATPAQTAQLMHAAG